MKRKTRENKSSRKIVKDPIRENKFTQNVKKKSLAKINPRECLYKDSNSKIYVPTLHRKF